MNVEIWNLAEILDIGIGSVHPACKVSEVTLLVRPVNFCLKKNEFMYLAIGNYSVLKEAVRDHE